MSSNREVLSIELDNLQRKENQMYIYYGDLLKKISDEVIKSKIKIIRDQEKGHIEIATKLISSLLSEINK